MLLQSSQGTVEIESAPFAGGGEGSIHNVPGSPGLVAKLYHPSHRIAQTEQKLLAMLEFPPKGEAAGQIAWPTDVLHDENGVFMGFLMPRVSGSLKIDALYSYDRRDDYPYALYIRVAKNLCAAVEAVHQSGHVCGDLNPANIFVHPTTALVTLVDTDSYQIQKEGRTLFRCGVCRAEYVPVELQQLMEAGENLRTTDRETFTKATDYFALAIHVFALLMNGCHPYACVVPEGESASDFNIQNNILEGRFPFLADERPLRAPRYAPFLGDLPKLIGGLFTVTFWSRRMASPQERATPSEWYDALEDLERSLCQCLANPMHQYWSGAVSCPLCAAKRTVNELLGKETPQGVSPDTSVSQSRPPGRTHSIRNTWLGYGAGVLIWLVFELLAFFLISKVPLSAWWWQLLRYLLTGIQAYLPLWSVFSMISWLEKRCNDDFLTGVFAPLDNTRWLVRIIFGGGALLLAWGNLLAMLIMPIAACLPAELLRKLLPDYTDDLL